MRRFTFYLPLDESLEKFEGFNPSSDPEALEKLTKLEAFLSDPSKKTIRMTYVNTVRVSTVFLGIDHNFFLSDPEPVLFETMIFGGPYDGFQRRYKTKTEALEGHQKTADRYVEVIAQFFA